MFSLKKKLFWIMGIILLFGVILTLYFVSAIISGPRNPTVGADDSSIGTLTWTSPTNIYSSNNAYAVIPLPTSAEISHYLKATGYGFAIPYNSIIDGILVEVEAKKDVQGSYENSIKIVKDGVISGDEKSLGRALTDYDTYYSFGSSTDLWGLTWNTTDINSNNFGVVVSYSNEILSEILVDHMRITVYYSETSCYCPPINTNWVIDMSESCNIVSTCDIGTGDISFVSTGDVIFNAKIDSANMQYPSANQIVNIAENALVRLG